MTMPKNYDHLTVAFRLPDPAFDDFFAAQMGIITDVAKGGTVTLDRRKLECVLKIAFLAGREAVLAELNLAGRN